MTTGTRRPVSTEPQKPPRSARSLRRRAARERRAQAHGDDGTTGLVSRLRSRIGGPDEIDLRSEVHPRIAGRRDEVESANRTRRRRFRLAALGAAAALSLAAAVVFSPLFDMDHFLVEGVEGAPAAEVAEAAGLSGGTALLTIDPAEVRASIESLPWMAHASVEVHWPDRVEVLATPRRPVANVAVGEGEPVGLLGVGGWVMSWEDAGPLVGFSGSLPVLRVGDLEDPALLDEGLVVLDVLGPATTAATSEVRLGGADDITLVLDPAVAGGAQVLMGSGEALPEKALAAEAVLSGNVETRCLATLDVSVPSRVTIERVPGCDLPPLAEAEDR